MPTFKGPSEHRRRLLQWLSASPLLPYAGFAGAAPDIPSKLAELEAAAALIAKPEDALNVFDFEPVFRKNVPPAHAGYMYSGIDAEVTLKANRAAFEKYYLRPRRLNDVSKVDTSVEIFGVKYASPICISTVASTSIDAAIKARGGPVWFQLYATSTWNVARQLVLRAERAGSNVVAVTVDRVA